VRAQPRKIVLDSRSVHDEQEFLLFDSVGDQIVDNSRLIVKQKSVLPGADFELRDVVRQHRVEPLARARPGRDQLAHV